MSFLTSILRFFCLNFMLNRGSWNPNELHTSDKPRKILNEKFSTKSSKKEDTLKKPAWLKEWTISKGWVHNKSHLLELGRKKLEAMEDLSDSSSVSLENIDELISIKSSEITIKNEELNSLQEDENVLNRRTEIRMSQIFKQVNSNYRDNFPICNHVIGENKELSLPQIYKERLLMERNGCNLFTDMWKYVKPNQKKKLELNNCKFTVNPVYDETKRIENHQKYTKKNSLGRNITLLNTLNAKTNLHEDTIYECSEENSANYNSLNNIYFNPVYAHLPLRRFENFNSNQISEDFTRFSTKTEKYVIRHIKIRIMLSLRVGRFKKINKNSKKKRRNIFGFKKSENKNVNMKVARIHDEQRRIGNGRTSVKIQNMRYGRLNVLRWLLWEAESREDMPALEKAIANNTTLALHYAAARGCLDCVRLLVDSSPELSANTQMDNDVTPVYLAAQEGHLEVLKFLVLEAGGSLYVRAKDGMAPIHAASQMGCLNCVKWMIQDQNVDPNLRDGDGATPLHFAASRGHLDTVRWLLKHGARLSLDKFGKSPINDAAENQQVECLNVLVQHGTTPDYQSSMEKNSNGKGCSCTRKGDKLRRGNSVASDCSNCKPKSISNKNTMKHNYSEPFYLHPPLSDRSMEPPHAPENGLYINPMSKHRHSASGSSDSSVSSGNGESFYLHNPQEVIYNRVKDLFETTQRQQGISALTVKVEVHSSSSGAGSDENLSSSDLSERSGEHEHDYEDIYMIREETKERNKNRSRSRDSGSHSRSASLTSSTSGGHVVVHLTTDTNNNENKEEHCKIEDLPNKEKGAPQESGVSSGTSHLNSEDEPEKTKLGPRHSLPAKSNTTNSKILKRVTSVPIDTFPPPPPPPLPKALGLIEPDDEPRGAEIVEIVEEPTLRPSDILKGMCRSMSALSARRLNSSCSDLTIVSLEGEEADKHGPNLVNRQRVLPFIPPSFPSSASSNNLIKPSEYLKSIGDKRSSVSSVRSLSESEDTEEKKEVYRGAGPPPPPLPDSNLDEMVKKQNQPLSAISIQDLNSVQLRRTEKVPASKTFSAPTRSMSLQCLQSEPFLAQKIDLIAELKMSKDITGIKKMKIEKAKCDESKEKEIFSEITKQLTTTRFVEKVPEKDNTGNIIPVWKRQMLAKKAAEKARKELEEQLLREAEEKRLQAIPQWKRQLLQKKEEAETKMRSTIYTPKVVDDIKITKKLEQNVTTTEDNDNDYDDVNNDESIRFENESNEMEDQSEEETPNIIPWRAHLRKTNSKLNLLG